jgi:hypothetical protein
VVKGFVSGRNREQTFSVEDNNDDVFDLADVHVDSLGASARRGLEPTPEKVVQQSAFGRRLGTNDGNSIYLFVGVCLRNFLEKVPKSFIAKLQGVAFDNVDRVQIGNLAVVVVLNELGIGLIRSSIVDLNQLAYDLIDRNLHLVAFLHNRSHFLLEFLFLMHIFAPVRKDLSEFQKAFSERLLLDILPHG